MAIPDCVTVVEFLLKVSQLGYKVYEQSTEVLWCKQD